MRHLVTSLIFLLFACSICTGDFFVEQVHVWGTVETTGLNPGEERFDSVEFFDFVEPFEIEAVHVGSNPIEQNDQRARLSGEFQQTSTLGFFADLDADTEAVTGIGTANSGGGIVFSFRTESTFTMEFDLDIPDPQFGDIFGQVTLDTGTEFINLFEDGAITLAPGEYTLALSTDASSDDIERGSVGGQFDFVAAIPEPSLPLSVCLAIAAGLASRRRHSQT